MLPQKSHLFSKLFSSCASPLTRKPARDWRNQNEETKLISEISSVLLQRHNWAPVLQTLNLSSKLTPSLFLRILRRTQTNPQLSLNFFNWCTTNLGFQPDLKTQCKLAQILIRFGFSLPSRPILDSLIRTHPSTRVTVSLINSCKGTDCQSLVLSSVLECYCNKGSYLQALEVYQKAKDHGHVISTHSCNSLLSTLEQGDLIRLAWCFYASMLRNGVLVDQTTWSIIARILYKDEKFEKITRIIDTGIQNSVMYNLLIEYYSKRGNFDEAFDYLKEMYDRKLNPDFSTYSSILEGACKNGDENLIELTVKSMVENGYIPKLLLTEYDSIIKKLCDLGYTYTVEMLCKKALSENIKLQDATYGCMLAAFSKQGRVQEAIEVYKIISNKRIIVKDGCYNEFGNLLCREEPSEQVTELLMEVIKRRCSPCTSELSRYINSQFDKHRWREAEKLMNVIIEKGFWPDSLKCSSLMKHYCSIKMIDSAIELHNKMEKFGASLDVHSYNLLLNRLSKERRAEEALKVFDYMRRKNVVDSSSFTILICGLCDENEMKKAMTLHNEMLKMDLKPDVKSYKRLITSYSEVVISQNSKNAYFAFTLSSSTKQKT